MDTQSTERTVASQQSFGGIVRRGAVALAIAVAGNILFVTAANLVGVAPTFEAYSPLIVARGSAVGVVGATVTYGILSRVRADPNRLFEIVAAVVYVVGLVPVVLRAPGMSGATTLGVALLPVMHAVVAVPCVVVLTGRLSWP